MLLKEGMRFLIKYHKVPGCTIEIREVREDDVRVYVMDPFGIREPEGLIVPKKAFGPNWNIYTLLDGDDDTKSPQISEEG